MWAHSFSAPQAGSCPATENAASREPLVSSSRSSRGFLGDNTPVVLFAASFFSLCFDFLGIWRFVEKVWTAAGGRAVHSSEFWPVATTSLSLGLARAHPGTVLSCALFRASSGKSLRKSLGNRFPVLCSYKPPSAAQRPHSSCPYIQSELRNVCQLAVHVILCFYSRSILERALGFFVYEDNEENPV